MRKSILILSFPGLKGLSTPSYGDCTISCFYYFKFYRMEAQEETTGRLSEDNPAYKVPQIWDVNLQKILDCAQNFINK
jgi:hypothetical protein